MELIKSDAAQRKEEKLKNLISNQVRVFLAIVEEGSITAAAARLSVGKSGVSDVLKSLEVLLGVQLLTRTTRRQTLTPIGQKFYRQCRVLVFGTAAMFTVNCEIWNLYSSVPFET